MNFTESYQKIKERFEENQSTYNYVYESRPNTKAIEFAG